MADHVGDVAAPDLGAVDDLCRLTRAARRLGCTVRLGGVTDELRALIDLAGVSDVLLDTEPAADTDRGALP